MSITQDLALARQLASVSDRLAVGRTPADVRSWAKTDGSEITELDLAIEEALLAVLARERPDDAILAEESGSARSPRAATGRRWVIDPLDGTRKFLRGESSWGTHIALEEDGRIVVAVITRPSQGVHYWAALGQGAWMSRGAAPSAAQPLRLTAQTDLAAAKVVGFVDEPVPLVDAVGSSARWLGDEMMVIEALLEGRVDALIDVGGHPWDQAPLTLLVPEAGGCFCDPRGGRTFDSGFGLYSSNAGLHGQLWEVVAPYLRKEG